MDVDALLLDVGGTVFDWKSAVSSTLDGVQSQALQGLDSDDFSTGWRTRSLIEIEAIADGTAPWRPFDPVLKSSLEQILSDLGIDRIPDCDRCALLAAWEAMPVWPEVPAAIARLRTKFFVAPHTILSLRAAAFSSKRAGVTWDAIVTCDALGATKLNPESYARALATIGRPAERVCFIAAHPSDLRAAKAHGMKTAYVVARLHDYGDAYEDTGFADEFDLVADDFAGLAEVMGC